MSIKKREDEEIPQGQVFNSAQEFEDFLENFSDASAKSFNFSAILNEDIEKILRVLSESEGNHKPSDFQIFWGERKAVDLKMISSERYTLWCTTHAPKNAKLTWQQSGGRMFAPSKEVEKAIEARVASGNGTFKINYLYLSNPTDNSLEFWKNVEIKCLCLVGTPNFTKDGLWRAILEKKPKSFAMDWTNIDDQGKFGVNSWDDNAPGDDFLLKFPKEAWEMVEASGYICKLKTHEYIKETAPTFEELKSLKEQAIKKMNGVRNAGYNSSFSCHFELQQD